MDKGTLYIVSTPIGNLSDITYRAVKTLTEADAIAAEDTRHTLKLLSSLNIKNRLISFHEHSHAKKAQAVINLLLEGKSIALVTDAGTPLISDPGAPLIALAHENNIPVTAVPGACAAVTALSLSGISCERFVFEGFLPRDSSRRGALARVSAYECTCIIYESPHRLAATLSELLLACGDRRISVCKELTKLHECVERTTLAAAAEKYGAMESVKGEYVLVLEGVKKELAEVSDSEIMSLLEKHISSGQSGKSAVKLVSEELSLPKNRVYQIMLGMK